MAHREGAMTKKTVVIRDSNGKAWKAVKIGDRYYVEVPGNRGIFDDRMENHVVTLQRRER